MLEQCSIVLEQCSIMLRQCSITLGQCSIMLEQCSIMLEQCSIMRAQYSKARFAKAGEINNVSSDLRIFGRLCDSDFRHGLLVPGRLVDFGKTSLYFHLPHSVVAEV